MAFNFFQKCATAIIRKKLLTNHKKYTGGAGAAMLNVETNSSYTLEQKEIKIIVLLRFHSFITRCVQNQMRRTK